MNKEIIKAKLDFYKTLLTLLIIAIPLGGLLGYLFDFKGARGFLLAFAVGFLFVIFFRFARRYNQLHCQLIREIRKETSPNN